MEKHEYAAAIRDLIYLLKCAANEKTPDKSRIGKMDLDDVYIAAQRHMVTAAAAKALSDADVDDKRFSDAFAMSVRNNIIMDSQRKALSDHFEKAGIWYMPLKGSVLKDYYPKYGMRQMADNDILFDKNYQTEVKDYFESIGFYTKYYQKGIHDVYMKEPVSNFEMHTALFAHNFDDRICKYYENVKSRLIPDKAGSLGHHFSDEDFYIYITAHEYKHYSSCGTGLRSLLDTYIFLRKFGDGLDHNYIAGELEKLGISDFEQKNRSLAQSLFGKGKLTDENKEMLRYIVFSGTYGTLENFVRNRLKKIDDSHRGKMKYLIDRLFLPLDTIKDAYPFFYKYKFLLPVLALYRIGRALTVSRKYVISEIKILHRTK